MLYREISLPSTIGEIRFVFVCLSIRALTYKVLHRLSLTARLVMHSRNSFTGPRRVYASMFGDVAGIVEEKRDGVGQIITNFSALNISDPTTFGMWRLGGDPSETVYNAIKAGYRRFDSACDYGNEVLTGRGIRRAIADSIVKRDELYITTKLWNTYHHPNHVSLALDRCLQDLGLDYVDEFLIHFPISMEVSFLIGFDFR